MIKFSDRIEIDGRIIGACSPCYVIAEAGVSHFGSMKKAFQLVDMAVEAKADAVKFQIFQADEMISGSSAEWRRRMASRQLPYNSFKDIQEYAKSRGITFFATAHDGPSLDYLDCLDVPVLKIGSGEVHNWPFIREIASRRKPVILSSGMYTLDDVETALEIFSDQKNPDVAVLHCITQYPTPAGDVNLRVFNEIKKRFEVITGYSDHTRGFHIPLAAAAMGAQVVEKHITLEFDIPDAQDWKVSCDREQLVEMVRQIREIEFSFGDGKKMPVASERESLLWAR